MGKFRKVDHLPVRRKLALHTWGKPRDPSIYSIVEVDLTRALPYLDRVSEETGVKLTPTHLVAKGLALAMARYPDLNGVIRWGRIYRRETVDVGFLVALEGGKDLNNVTVKEADKKDLLDIGRELQARAAAMRRGKDETVARQKGSLQAVPHFLMGPLMDTLEFLAFDVGLDLKALGLESDKFGSVMVTSVGMLGIETALAPLVPFTRVPIVCLVGEVKDKPVVRDGDIVVAPVLTLGFTIDHRFADGVILGKMLSLCKAYWENPEGIPAAAEAPEIGEPAANGANGTNGHLAHPVVTPEGEQPA